MANSTRELDSDFAFRRRVGDWRILFDASPERRVIEVADVARRSSTTYRKR